MTNTTPPSSGTADALTGWTPASNRQEQAAALRRAGANADGFIESEHYTPGNFGVPSEIAGQAPAADPALDALDLIARRVGQTATTLPEDLRFQHLVATIRAALADRITPAEARAVLEPMEADPGLRVWKSAEAKLRRTAARDEVTGR